MVQNAPDAPGVSRETIVREARSMLGTPFRHMGRSPGVRLDCGGMVSAVGHRLGIPHETLARYSPRPGRSRLMLHLDRYMWHGGVGLPEPAPSISDARPGMVALFRLPGFALDSHCGVVASWQTAAGTELSLVHAYIDAGRVVESALAGRWASLLVKLYDYPGAEGSEWRP